MTPATNVLKPIGTGDDETEAMRLDLSHRGNRSAAGWACKTAGKSERGSVVKYVHQALGLIGLPHLAFETWWRHRRPFEVMTSWNERNRAFFVHIPKTAGTSIYDSLGMDKLPYTHAPARILQELYPVEYSTYFSFSFVRNPWDRLVSTFEFLRDGTSWSEQQAWARDHLGDQSFREFIVRLDREPTYRAAILSYNFFFPQTYFLSDRRGRIIVERIYKFEDIQMAYAELAARFGCARELGHSRRTDRRFAFQSYYDDETWRIAGGLYREDVKSFGYSDRQQAVAKVEAGIDILA